MQSARLLALILAIACFGAAAQVVFLSRDANGRLVVSDKPHGNEAAANAPSKSGPRQAPTAYVAGPLVKSTAPATTVAISQEVVLYAADWCPYCRRARQYLRSNAIRYTDIDVDSVQGQKAFAAVSRGSGIPLLVAGDRQLRGFSERSYDAFFKTLR